MGIQVSRWRVFFHLRAHQLSWILKIEQAIHEARKSSTPSVQNDNMRNNKFPVCSFSRSDDLYSNVFTEVALRNSHLSKLTQFYNLSISFSPSKNGWTDKKKKELVIVSVDLINMNDCKYPRFAACGSEWGLEMVEKTSKLCHYQSLIFD
jgi:hypothetical protein